MAANSKVILMILGLVVLLALLGGGVYMYRKNKKSALPSDAFDKSGNNGAVSCNTYCQGAGWGPVYKRAVSAKLLKTGEMIDVDKAPGVKMREGAPADSKDPADYGENGLQCICTNT